MTQQDTAPRPVGRQDAAALVGISAVLEGHLVAGHLDAAVVDSLNRHLGSAGLVGPGAGPAELRLALAGLNHRLRHVLGEHDDDSAQLRAGEVEQYFGFATEPGAREFAAEARAQGQSGHEPVPVDGRAYDGEVRWQVAVRTPEPPLSAEFDARVQRLRALAAGYGGTYGGWGGVRPG